MARVRLRLFAALREAVGEGVLVLDVPDGSTVRELVDRVCREHPSLDAWREAALVSVNHEFATGTERLSDGDEVGFMPPVSGGDGTARVHDGALSLDDAVQGLVRDGAGATVCFLGTVRVTSGERPDARVDRLEFEAYPEMADRKLEEVRAQAVEKFDLTDATILHRIGTLHTGEDIVLVAVAAAHRREAFEAAAWIMDALKSVVPIWKREVGPDGARWVNDPRETDAS